MNILHSFRLLGACPGKLRRNSGVFYVSVLIFPYHVSFVLGSVLFIAFIQRSILSRTKVSQSLITDAYELVAESKKRKQVALRDGSCMFKIPGDSIDHKAILPEALSVVSQLNRAGF